jgi:hypothetical protein
MVFVGLSHAIYTRKQPPSNLVYTCDDQVRAGNAVRLMDAFIDKLDLQKLWFTSQMSLTCSVD